MINGFLEKGIPMEKILFCLHGKQLLLLLCVFSCLAQSQTVVGSKHDISTAGTPETCTFCHTPHYANGSLSPLWNRNIDLSIPFQVYTSSTMNTLCSNPPSSITQACLSCHDGVNANTKHVLRNAPGPGSIPDTTSMPNCLSCHGSMSGGEDYVKLGKDLRNDHPVSMTYPTPAQDPGFFIPPDLTNGWVDLPLYNGKVECSTCHNVHNPTIAPFLRVANNSSSLCFRCHNK
jgi:predicted CXXCH cytochrome family protein